MDVEVRVLSLAINVISLIGQELLTDKSIAFGWLTQECPFEEYKIEKTLQVSEIKELVTTPSKITERA